MKTKKSQNKSAFAFKFSDLFSKNYQIITAILILLPLLIYWQVWDFELVWDDDGIGEIRHLNNQFVANPSFSNFFQLFTQPYFGMYIPISYLFWGGLKAFAEVLNLPVSSVLHLTNVIIHIINGLLVFTILKNFVANKWAVLLGTLFFLLHPLQVEVVAWISEFRNLLAFFFSFSALYFYLKNQTKFSFLPLFLFALALLSKPSAVVLPLMIFAINHFHYQFKLKNNIAKTLPFALLALLAAIIIINIQSFSVPESQLASYFQRPIIWLNNIALYLKNLLYPLLLSAVYGLPVPYLVHQWWFYILPIVPISLAFGLYFIGKKRQILLLAGSLFLLGFLPTSGLVSFSFQLVSVVADRYLYFAFIGISLAISVVAERKNFSIILAIILLIFTLISAFKQIPVWQNELKLWNYAVSHAQYDKYYAKNALASAWHNEGWDLARRGKNQQALAIFDKIIANKFNHKLYFIGNTFYLRGVIMMQQKHYQKALSDFDKSIASKHKNSNSDEGKIGSHEGKIAVFTALRQCENASFEIDFMRKNKLKIPVFLLTDFHKNCPKPLPPRID